MFALMQSIRTTSVDVVRKYHAPQAGVFLATAEGVIYIIAIDVAGSTSVDVLNIILIHRSFTPFFIGCPRGGRCHLFPK